MKLTKEEKKELVASEELDTYLGGLKDALAMSKAKLQASIEYLQNYDPNVEVDQK